MNRTWLAALLALTLAPTTSLAADRVLLVGGAIAEGRIVSESETEVVLLQGEREIRIPRASVRLMDRERERVAPAATAAASPASAEDPTRAGAKGVPAHAAATRPTPGVPAGAAAASGTPLPPVPVVDARIMLDLAGAQPAARAAALEDIVRGWPATKATLEAALTHALASVRLAATQLLGRPELGETRVWVLNAMSDTFPGVRCAALRIARTYRDPALEPRMIEAVATEADPGVRVEALRCLEFIGTPACLPAVLAQFEREPTVSSRRRWLRVLKSVSREDHGDDALAWRAAVTRLLELGRRAPVARAATAPGGPASDTASTAPLPSIRRIEPTGAAEAETRADR